MDSLSKLQRRKAELKAQIEQERLGLKITFLEIREEMEPGNLLKKAVRGVFGFTKKKTSEEVDSVLNQLPAPVSFLVDILVKDPKWALGLKLIAPVAMKFIPKIGILPRPALESNLESGLEKPGQVTLYGRLRKGVSTLRSRLRNTGNTPEINTDKPEN